MRHKKGGLERKNVYDRWAEIRPGWTIIYFIEEIGCRIGVGQHVMYQK